MPLLAEMTVIYKDGIVQSAVLWCLPDYGADLFIFQSVDELQAFPVGSKITRIHINHVHIFLAHGGCRSTILPVFFCADPTRRLRCLALYSSNSKLFRWSCAIRGPGRSGYSRGPYRPTSCLWYTASLSLGSTSFPSRSRRMAEPHSTSGRLRKRARNNLPAAGTSS